MGEVVLVHGAWHGAWCFDGVVARLQDLGVPATAVELPLTGLTADVAAARTAIEAASKPVVVLGHSYGGMVITAAASGVPGVTRLIYLAAFLTEPGTDITALTSPRLLQAVVVTSAGVGVDPAEAADIFYGDADPATAAAAVARLRPMALDAADPWAEPAWRSVPATYVVCARDEAIPVSAQRAMAARAQTVVEWPADHSPFLTRPADVADLAAGYLA
jgi:pimeloyl-ACP methyl ester carboxylesterase